MSTQRTVTRRRGAAALLGFALLAAPCAAVANSTRATQDFTSAPTLSLAAATKAKPTSTYLPGTKCRAFPASSIFHADISKAPRNKKSKLWLKNMHASTRRLHPDFGPSYGAQPVPYGIPITVAKKGHAKVKVHFAYSSESDKRRYPLGGDTRIEGGKNADGDRHAIVVDAAACRLYETWDTHKTASGWTAGSGASWSLTSNALRPKGWTSADAAGLPILPLLLRYDEVKSGTIDHPIRFTTDITRKAYVWPARHQAGSRASTAYPPMGAWFRLKASFSTKGYSRDAKVVIAAMKKHGMILADNGSPWYFQGTSDKRFSSSFIEQLKRIPASAFEAIDVSKLKVSANSAKAK